MNEAFDILDYISGLTAFIFDKSSLVGIARERNVIGITDFEQLTQKDKDLLKADCLFLAYTAPNTIASNTHQHGAFTEVTGSQSIQQKKEIYRVMLWLYKKWDDEKADLLEEMSGGLSWINIMDL